MTDKLRFYLDENIANAIAEGLRTQNIDVLTTPEAGNRGLSDVEHVAFALAQQRVIVTRDEDFLILASQQIEHAGIAYYKHGTRTIKQILAKLIALHKQFSPEDMLNHVEFL